MKSSEFKRLLYSLYSLKKKVERINLRLGEQTKGTVTFDDGEEIVVCEPDTIDYLFSLKRIVDNDGDYVFHPMRDLEKYFSDEEFLCRDHDEKVVAASHELARGDFKFSYNLEELQEEFLLSNKRNDKKYLPLKTDYFRIAAYRMSEAATMLRLHEKNIEDSPEYRKHFDAVCRIVADAFRNDANFMKNFMNKGKSTKIDLLDSINKYASALQGAQEIRPVFQPEGLKAETGIRLILSIYRNYAEACVEPLNFLRISYEFSQGVSNPLTTKSAQENRDILLPVLKDLLNSYNPHLRNSESHLNTKLDHKNNKLLITDRGGYSQEYTYAEVIEMTNDLAHNFLPGLMNGITMESQTVMLILSARSAEYVAALLGVDNAE
jgi:hypothetical protein